MYARRVLRLILVPMAASLALACNGDKKPAATAPPADKASAEAAAAKGDKGPAEASKAAPEGEKVKVVEGAPPSADDRYALSIEAPEGAVGKEGKVTVRVVPNDPWHMNLDFPTSLQLTAPDGIALTKADLKKADAVKLDDESCQFDVTYTPNEPGEQVITGTFKFAVCQDEACSPVTEDVELKVAVK